jgi:hypothetical protein
MRPAYRFDEFRTVQRESMQVAGELRKALGALCSPLGGTFVPRRVGLMLYVMGAATVPDRRNSRLP